MARKEKKQIVVGSRSGTKRSKKRSGKVRAQLTTKPKIGAPDVISANGHSSASDAKRAIAAIGDRTPVKLNGNTVQDTRSHDPTPLPVGDGSRATRPINRKPLNGHATAAQEKTRGKSKASVIYDLELVQWCLSGNVSAWSALYRQCHGPLLGAIRSFLGQAGNDTNLVEEIAARTWYALVKDDSKLLSRFDSKYGCRLTTFLSLLAKNEARLLLRTERRLKCREQVASRHEVEKPSPRCITAISDEEFIATLSPAERTFCLNVLFAEHRNVNDSQYTKVNKWQLRHRVRTKLEQYLR